MRHTMDKTAVVCYNNHVIVEQQIPRTFRSDAVAEAVWHRRANRLKRRWWTQRLISAFIIWQLFVVAVWIVPRDWPVANWLIPNGNGGIIRDYMTITSFMQCWQMFAPNPDSRDVYMDADITFADGTHRIWAFPRVTNMNYIDKYRRERVRKWVEIAESNRYVWPSLARYAAQCNDKNPNNPPNKVLLVFQSRLVAPPGQPAARYQPTPFYTMIFTPGELR